MIDLHCHLLAGTACGPKDFAESLKMCHGAASDGVRTIVATPRWDAPRDEPPLAFSDCERQLKQLQQEMRGALLLRPGFLMRFRVDLPLLLERYGTALTLGGGRYVLVSLPPLRTPVETESVWDAVRQMGFAIIIARPECSPALRRSPERLGRWVTGGVKLQLDVASINGAHGREVQRFAMWCVREYKGRVVVASGARDGHPTRASLALARETLLKTFGERRTRQLLIETPEAIIKTGAIVQPGDQDNTQNSTLLSRLRALRPQKTVLNET